MAASSGVEEATGNCKFELLAPELLLAIVTQLPDLLTLDCLLRASPSTFRLFEEYGVEITEAVLSAGFTHRHIQVIIRIDALIRSSAFPIKSVEDFRVSVTREAIYHRIRKSPSGFAPQALSDVTAPAVLRSILATNRTINFHAFELLNQALGRFRALSPRHLVSIPRPRSDVRVPMYLPNGQLGTESKAVKVRDVGPPSWVEEQRVIRAFWRLQLVDDLKRAVNNGMIDWSELEILRMNNSGQHPENLLYGEYFPCVKIPGARVRVHPEIDELLSVMEFVQKQKDKTTTRTQVSGECWLEVASQEAMRKWEVPTPNALDWRKLSPASSGCTHYAMATGYAASIYGPHGYYVPFRHTKFDAYRHLGFAFWDYERLWNYGLKAPPRNGPKYQAHFYYFAWLSILSVEEIQEEERKMKLWRNR